MAGRTRQYISDEALLGLTLNAFWRRGELKESDLYEINGSRARTPELLDKLTASGVLKTRRLTEGRKVLVYSFTDKGRMLYYVNRLRTDIMEDPCLDMRDEGMAELFRVLEERYGEAEPPPGPRTAETVPAPPGASLGLCPSRPLRELCFYIRKVSTAD